MADFRFITYTDGSIENPKIRESICKLLEGGRRGLSSALADIVCIGAKSLQKKG